jgi:hypothetical protein
MADDKKTTPYEAEKAPDRAAQTPPESSASPDAERRNAESVEDVKVPVAPVAGPENMRVGDDEQREPREVDVLVVSEDQALPKVDQEIVPVETTPVHETYVQLDVVDLEAGVDIPDAGRGFLDLPIHQLAGGTPEERIARGEDDEESRTLVGTSPQENDFSNR